MADKIKSIERLKEPLTEYIKKHPDAGTDKYCNYGEELYICELNNSERFSSPNFGTAEISIIGLNYDHFENGDSLLEISLGNEDGFGSFLEGVMLFPYEPTNMELLKKRNDRLHRESLTMYSKDKAIEEEKLYRLINEELPGAIEENVHDLKLKLIEKIQESIENADDVIDLYLSSWVYQTKAHKTFPTICEWRRKDVKATPDDLSCLSVFLGNNPELFLNEKISIKARQALKDQEMYFKRIKDCRDFELQQQKTR